MMASQGPSAVPVDEAVDSTTTPWTPKVREKFETKSRSEYMDPCQEAAAKSIRCLHRNGGERSMCQDYFQAYRDCKKLWLDKRQEDKRKLAEERRAGGGWFS